MPFSKRTSAADIQAPLSKGVATAVGGGAVLLWAMLALLTGLSGSVPPFQLAALSFAIAFVAANVVWLVRGQSPFQHLKQPALAWAVGVGGLFGYHFFYFLALRNAPLVEAGLIAYLWPLLIVVFASLASGGGGVRIQSGSG